MANTGNLQNLIHGKKKNDGPQTLKGNGAFPPAIKRDAPSVASKKQLTDSRRQAIKNMNDAELGHAGSHVAHKGDDNPPRAKRPNPFAKRS